MNGLVDKPMNSCTKLVYISCNSQSLKLPILAAPH